LIRQNVTESQPGVPLTVDIQMIDINTCKPIPSIYLDFWHCNSTGVYSGVNANGNGNSNDTANLDATFLRGISASDGDGVVTVHSVFPGFYTGRATHIHIMSHSNVTLNANKTLSGTGQVAHVGQMFFDQDLITQVNKVSPYKSNTQSQTQNSDDSILSQAAEDVDPILEYVLLGDSISDGILAWTTIGINVTGNYTVSAAATIYESGGVANANGGMGGGGSGGPGGAMPSGGIPGGNGTASTSGTATVTTDGVATASGTASSSGSASTGKLIRCSAVHSACC
jgi:protocatechuate 3,4-dioxygenase beta subunit